MVVVYIYYQRLRVAKLLAAGTFGQSLAHRLLPHSCTAPSADSRLPVPEDRLEIGFLASLSIPVVTLLFGWTARESVHWIFPVIFGALYLPGVFFTFQSIL